MSQPYPPQQYPPQQYPPQQNPPQQQQYYQASPQAQVYDPNWVPPPVVGSEDPNVQVDYNYDPVHTQVSYITVAQWNQIENDKSPYSYLWAKGEFTPQKFAENQKKNDEFVDGCWLIAFWVNFLITLVFMIVICVHKCEPSVVESNSTTKIMTLAQTFSNDPTKFSAILSDNTTIDDELEEVNTSFKKSIMKGIGVGVGIGLLLTILHFCYMAFAPSFYIKFGLFVGVLLIIIVCLIPMFIDKTLAFACLGIAAFVLLLSLCIYCCCLKEFIEFTCMVFEKTVDIEKNHPMIFLVIAVQIIVELAFNLIYSFSFIFIFYNNWSYVIYIYYLFSYYWAVATNYYVFFLISANLAANCYFLDGTEYLPENPLWDSVKKSLTKTFGSASLAGFIAAIIQILEYLAREMIKQDNIVCKIIGCIALCILCCLKAMFKHISRYGLFYVTVYNIPFLEGARRFTEVQVKKFITTFMGESILDTSLTWNSFIFGFISIVLGLAIGFGVFRSLSDDGEYSEAIFSLILYPVFVIMFTEVFLWCLLNPADTITYSLFICFTEYPERLKVVNNIQYEFFVYRYQCCTARETHNELPPRPASLPTND